MDRKRIAFLSAGVIAVALVLVFRTWSVMDSNPIELKMAPGEFARTEDEPEH